MPIQTSFTRLLNRPRSRERGHQEKREYPHSYSDLPDLTGYQPAESDAHTDVVQAAVQVPQQAALERRIGLPAREQILHDGRKARAAARELHHAGGDGFEEEAAAVHAFGKP